MADSEQIQRLKESVTEWNQWREKNTDIQINLDKVDLRDGELSGANLRSIQMISANLSNANLSNADLSHSKLINSTFSFAQLHSTSFRRSNLEKSKFRGVDATKCNLRETNLQQADFQRSDLSDAMLWNANCKDANFQHGTMSRVDLTQVDLRDANLEFAVLDDAFLEGADLRRCSLIRAFLRSTNLSKAKLDKANFQGANLKGAILTRADLRGAINLTCEQLTEAQDWESAYRDAELACGASIPDIKEGATAEVPTSRIVLPRVQIHASGPNQADEGATGAPTGDTSERTLDEIDDSSLDENAGIENASADSELEEFRVGHSRVGEAIIGGEKLDNAEEGAATRSRVIVQDVLAESEQYQFLAQELIRFLDSLEGGTLASVGLNTHPVWGTLENASELDNLLREIRDELRRFNDLLAQKQTDTPSLADNIGRLQSVQRWLSPDSRRSLTGLV